METPQLISFTILVLIIACGAFIAGYMTRDLRLLLTGNINQDNGTVVLYVVSIVWAVSMLVDIISPTYETSPLVHGLMGAIVGFFYRPKINEKSSDNDKK